jgi:hypothetical protein
MSTTLRHDDAELLAYERTCTALEHAYDAVMSDPTATWEARYGAAAALACQAYRSHPEDAAHTLADWVRTHPREDCPAEAGR